MLILNLNLFNFGFCGGISKIFLFKELCLICVFAILNMEFYKTMKCLEIFQTLVKLMINLRLEKRVHLECGGQNLICIHKPGVV